MDITTINPWEILGRLGLALIFGSLVGLERERLERGAGLRTHALVCMGAALIMLVSSYGFNAVINGTTIQLDPSRVAAQVVSGIGFLGAGTILLRREIVKGLTTAAGLWVVAGIGLAVGGGLYVTAGMATLCALIILAVLKPLEDWLFRDRRPRRLVLRLQSQPDQLSRIQDAFQHSGIRLRTLQLQVHADEGEETIRLDFLPTGPAAMRQLLGQLRALPGLIALETRAFHRPSTDKRKGSPGGRGERGGDAAPTANIPPSSP